MPTVTVTPDPLTHSDPACVQTDGSLPKKLRIDTLNEDGTHTITSLTLVEAKATWTVPATAAKVLFHDLSGECDDVTRIVAPWRAVAGSAARRSTPRRCRSSSLTATACRSGSSSRWWPTAAKTASATGWRPMI